MNERRVDKIKRERIKQQDEMIAKAQRMLDSNIDNELWERELDTVIDERRMIIDGNSYI